MSVHKRNGRWQVKWREAGRQRSRTFTRKGDADTFDREVARRRELGPHLVRELTRDALTLDAFVRAGFRTHAATLAQPTRDKYAWALERHLADLLDEPLAGLDVPRLARHQQQLLADGRSASTVRDVMARLSGILQVAVEHGQLPANPARAPWGAFDGDTLLVGRARTKRTAARTRTITVPAVTARELKAWRLEAGRPADDEPIIGPMTQNAMKLWGRRVLRPAARDATRGRNDVSLYTLRHSHASACHYAGLTIPEAARRLGHGPGLHVETYAHVIDRMTGTRHDDLDQLIRAARAELEFPAGSPTVDRLAP